MTTNKQTVQQHSSTGSHNKSTVWTMNRQKGDQNSLSLPLSLSFFLAFVKKRFKFSLAQLDFKFEVTSVAQMQLNAISTCRCFDLHFDDFKALNIFEVECLNSNTHTQGKACWQKPNTCTYTRARKKCNKYNEWQLHDLMHLFSI